MSKPRYGWWSYAKNMIRRYPTLKEEYEDLHRMNLTQNYSDEPRGGGAGRSLESVAIRELPHNKQREYEAVRRAIEQTERTSNARDRLYIIKLVLWDRSHTLEGAGLMVPCSIATAKRYHGEFIKAVAKYYGFLD